MVMQKEVTNTKLQPFNHLPVREKGHFGWCRRGEEAFCSFEAKTNYEFEEIITEGRIHIVKWTILEYAAF